jgi:hypothetical protein
VGFNDGVTQNVEPVAKAVEEIKICVKRLRLAWGQIVEPMV